MKWFCVGKYSVDGLMMCCLRFFFFHSFFLCGWGKCKDGQPNGLIDSRDPCYAIGDLPFVDEK